MIASDLSGFRHSPLWQSQLWNEVKQDSNLSMAEACARWLKVNVQLRIIFILLVRNSEVTNNINFLIICPMNNYCDSWPKIPTTFYNVQCNRDYTRLFLKIIFQSFTSMCVRPYKISAAKCSKEGGTHLHWTTRYRTCIVYGRLRSRRKRDSVFYLYTP